MDNDLINDLETIILAAEEGYRNAESDAGDGVRGAAEVMKLYGDAFHSIGKIREALRGAHVKSK